MIARFLVAAVGLLLLALFTPAETKAEHEEYAYKFPCSPQTDCWVTQLSHGSGDALDFDPGGTAESAAIPAMAPAIVSDVQTLQTTCSYPNHGLGMHVYLWDVTGRVTLYAHLSRVDVDISDQLLQGDQVGIEGDTGYTYTVRDGVIIPCAAHLHWEPGSLPTGIDGVPVNSLQAGQTYPSTNSVIGEYSTSGASLRTYYTNNGGWSDIGWTHAHCPGACTLT